MTNDVKTRIAISLVTAGTSLAIAARPTKMVSRERAIVGVISGLVNAYFLSVGK